MTEQPPIPAEANRRITTTKIDLASFPETLGKWLRDRLGTSGRPVISNVRAPKGSGMSSVSLLFDADWEDADGTAIHCELVARVAPEPDAVPVFPEYDLGRQFRVMRVVREHSSVPVPEVHWYEPSSRILGQPFLVMDQVTGRVPTDNPPYVFGGWLADLEENERSALESASVALLAQVHSIGEPERLLPELVSSDPLRAHLEHERDYYAWTRRKDGVRIPVLDRAFEWLERNWPAHTGPAVLNWGDARIGNIVYAGTEPVAVLDWESAALAPREIDLGWFLFFHHMFDDLARQFGMPGVAGFLEQDSVVAQYESAAGVRVGDMDFYIIYAALRHGIVMSQIHRRAVHFGEEKVPSDPDEYVLHHRFLTELLDNAMKGNRR